MSAGLGQMSKMNKIRRILVANRGEIAVRIIRAAHEAGIATVAVFSEADRKMPFVRLADYAVNIGGAKPQDSYLNIDKIVATAQMMECQAIHPGYGFLSENCLFAKKCEENGLIFIGPHSSVIEKMGDKLSAKRAVAKFHISLVPGTDVPVKDFDQALLVAENIGFPVMIKASAGGGGRGMRIVKSGRQLKEELQLAMSEAAAAFGNPSVFIEKFIEDPRHIEVQVMADQHGNVIHLNERECSIQRRHQKVIEESPSPVVNAALRKKLGKAAIDVAKACNYTGAGTVEFIMDRQKNFYFLEMNTRLQVEHPVTEFVTGLDLVKMQFDIAEGRPLALRQDEVKLKGHAIELRVSAEDIEENFSPSTGLINKYEKPGGDGIRIDDGYEEGVEIPVYYDPLISKLIVYAENRPQAIEKMLNAIDGYIVEGVKTTLPFGRFVMQNRNFIEGDFDTNFISRYFGKENQERNELLEKLAAVVSAEMVAEYQHNNMAVSKTKTNWRNRLNSDGQH